MLTYIYTVIKLAILTVFYSLYSTYKGRGGDSDAYHRSAYVWAKKLIKYLDIRLNITGLENLNKEENYVYIANHTSLIDIPVLVYALNDNIRIVYKKELEKVPIFGYGLKYSPFIAVTREGGAEAMKTLNEGIAAMKENKSILIFPEGTRSQDGKLGEFKRGAFLMAEKAEKKIVPVAVRGTNLILAKGKSRFKKGVNVNVIISPPEELPADRHKKAILEFIAKVREIILKNLNQSN